MRKLFAILFFCVVAFNVTAQPLERVKVSYVEIGDGLYDFYVENPNHCPMQFELYFTEFENMSADCKLPYVGLLQPGKKKVFQLMRIYSEIPGAFKYKYNTRVGAFPVTPEYNYEYKLPIITGNSTELVAYDFSNTRSPEKIVWGFKMNEGDTIKACREGIVYMKSKVRFRDSIRIGSNDISIVHPDNTMSKYELFSDNQIFVNLGDTVAAGTSLGIVDEKVRGGIIMTRFSVYYVNARIDSITANKIRKYHTYIDPVFVNGKGKEIEKENKLEVKN